MEHGRREQLWVSGARQIWVTLFTAETLDLINRVQDLGFDAIDINVGELPLPFPAAEL